MAILKKISLKHCLKDTLTQTEAAVVLGVSRQRVFTLCETGQLDTISVDGRLYPLRVSVEVYRESEKRQKHRPKKRNKSVA
jgi:hypothetical protein